MKKNNSPLKLVLASQSPRRKEILSDAGYKFATLPSNSSESFDENLTLHENLCRIAEEKIEGVIPKLNIWNKKGFLVLSADTVVVLQNQVLGKPKNRKDARRMLCAMSGKVHQVFTSYSVFNSRTGQGFTKVIQTKVGFRFIMRGEMEDYLDSGEPFDKAGAYGIQGLARAFINFVEGDLLNVMGLPLSDFQSELRKRKWTVGSAKRKGARRRR